MRPMEVEGALVARLKDKIPQARAVLTIGDLAGVDEAAQITPALHVIYRGYNVMKQTITERFANIQEMWVVVVAVRNSAQGANAAAAVRGEAAALVHAVFSALLGWKPDGGEPLAALTPPLPRITDGFGYFPVGFQLQVFENGDVQNEDQTT